MKKLIFMSLAAVAMLASCGGNKQKAQGAAEEKTFEQEQIEASIKMQVDSLASEFAKMDRMPFMADLKEGKIDLTEEEKQVKPEFLIDPASTTDLVTLSQKYRAVALLSADKTIANAYGLPTDDYEAAIKRLVIDIDDPAFKAFQADEDSVKEYKEMIENFYNQENENGRVNFFWETISATVIEELYIISKDPNNKFIQCFDDDAASNVTYRIILLQNGLNRLKEYDPQLNELCESIKPLEKLNAISVDQFKEQLAAMNDELQAMRDNLLK